MKLLDRFKDKPDAARQGDSSEEALYLDALADLDDPRQGPVTVQDPSLRTTVASTESPSIISEAAPSDSAPAYLQSRVAPLDPLRGMDGIAGARMPLIGQLTSDRQQKVLVAVLALGVFGLVLASVLAVRTAGGSATRVGSTGQALMETQRLSKAALLAVTGQAAAFLEVRESSRELAAHVRHLHSGSAELGSQGLLEPLLPVVERTDKGARTLAEQEKLLTEVGNALRRIEAQVPPMQEAAEAVAAVKVQQDALPAEVAAAERLVTLTQRIGRSTALAQSHQGIAPDAVFQLGKDLNTFRELAQGLLDGHGELRLTATRDPATRERLQTLLKIQDGLRNQSGAIVGRLDGLVAAREAQTTLIADAETLRKSLAQMQDGQTVAGGLGWFNLLLIGMALLLTTVGAAGLLRVFTHEHRKRAAVADAQRHEAERQEREAKRINDANQAAILRLMNELQSVAEGDLTQQATVTEDITGAIADSVNYTVEELRTLVAQVQGTVARVTDTTQQVEATSTELLAASDEQLREIRDTGEAVLQMAGRIQRVSGQAQQSAEVARDSLTAAHSGLTAVRDTISGMNTLREQIQETSKRIKRLGESSQEIGEITELISDITEQTNVLALNAAIQAASAGEAGRGFSVVAEEVQRLAERSGDATRAIAVLVKTIQTDTADAVAAMERSTQGVVEGARLSDNAGTALAEIDRVSRQLAELIEQISAQARREADSATVVAQNIQHIFAVTEQTGEGTRSTAQLVRQLSRTAEELRQSVARFKIA